MILASITTLAGGMVAAHLAANGSHQRVGPIEGMFWFTMCLLGVCMIVFLIIETFRFYRS